MFNQRHYWALEVGDTVCIGLSTVRFRSNDHSVHEVFIDQAQVGAGVGSVGCSVQGAIGVSLDTCQHLSRPALPRWTGWRTR